MADRERRREGAKGVKGVKVAKVAKAGGQGGGASFPWRRAPDGWVRQRPPGIRIRQHPALQPLSAPARMPRMNCFWNM